MAKSNKGLLLGAAALIGIGVVVLRPKPGEVVQASSGTSWRVALVSNTGGTKTYDVYTLGGTKVMRYSQTGSASNARTFLAMGEGVDPSVVRAAASDFGVPVPS